MSGYVYLLKCQDYHKIGIATDVQKRISGMQTGSPYPIMLVASVEVDNPLALEKELHSMYSHRHHRREWFALTEEDVEAIRSLFTGAKATAGTPAVERVAEPNVNILPAFFFVAIVMSIFAAWMLFTGSSLLEVFPVVSIFGGMLILLLALAAKVGLLKIKGY